jgi:hypothetical protein
VVVHEDAGRRIARPRPLLSYVSPRRAPVSVLHKKRAAARDYRWSMYENERERA